MFRWVQLLAAGLAALLVPAAPGMAQPNGPVLSLSQLTDMALKYSPEVKATKSEVDKAESQRDQAHGYRWPQLDATAITGPAPNSRRPEFRQVFGPGTGQVLFYPDGPNQLHGVNIFGRLDFAVIQPLYTFGKIAFRERAAERNIEVKKAGVDAKRAEIIVNVAQAYYGLVLAEQGKDAVKEARTYLKDTRERITRLQSNGSPNVKESDVYRLAVYEGAAEKFAAEAEEGAKVAYQALKALIGYGEGQDFRVPPELPTPSQAPGTLDSHIRQAVELRPEFTQIKEGLVARQLLVDAARADRYPSFFLAVVGAISGAPGRDRPTGNFRDPLVNDYFNEKSLGAVAGVKWHFDFGIQKAKIREAQAELEQLGHMKQAALLGIPVEVAQNYGKVQENFKKSAATEKSYVNARRWLITSFSNFDMGVGKMDDIFQAFEKYGQFRGDYLMSLYEYNLAVVQLDKATGAYRLKLPRGNNGGNNNR